MTRREMVERLKDAIDEWATSVKPELYERSTFKVTAVAKPPSEHGIPLPPIFVVEIERVLWSSEQLG